MTVEALVLQALEENTELQAARAEIDAAQGRLRQAGFVPTRCWTWACSRVPVVRITISWRA